MLEAQFGKRAARLARNRIILMWVDVGRGHAPIACVTVFPTGPIRAQNKPIWKPVQFAIVKLDDGPPKSWNMYHTEKRGVLLLKLWKRYLLVDVNQQEVYDIDPATVTAQADNVAWSPADKPTEPLDVTEWKQRDVGSMGRLRFRLPKNGAVVELQIPLLLNGKSAY